MEKRKFAKTYTALKNFPRLKLASRYKRLAHVVRSGLAVWAHNLVNPVVNVCPLFFYALLEDSPGLFDIKVVVRVPDAHSEDVHFSQQLAPDAGATGHVIPVNTIKVFNHPVEKAKLSCFIAHKRVRARNNYCYLAI